MVLVLDEVSDEVLAAVDDVVSGVLDEVLVDVEELFDDPPRLSVL